MIAVAPLRLVLLAALAAAVACSYAPSFTECEVQCAEGVCPSGMSCRADGYCHAGALGGAYTSCSIDAAVPDAQIPDAPAAVTLDDICNEANGPFVEAYGKLLECNPWYEVTVGPLPSRAELSTYCAERLGPFVDDGTIELGPLAGLEACREAARAAHCESLSFDLWEPGECRTLVRGTLGLGEDCEYYRQCAGAAYCDTTAGGECGSCAAQKEDGALCYDEGNECASGYCADFDEDTGAPGTCRSYRGLGGECTRNEDCLGRQVCDRSTEPPLCKSEPNWVVGTACWEIAYDCKPVVGYLYCDSKGFFGSEATDKCVEYLENGAPCIEAATPFCDVLHGEACLYTGTDFKCQAMPTVGSGDACGIAPEISTVCPADYLCGGSGFDETGVGVCLALRMKGQSCADPNDLCRFPLVCRDGVCTYNQHTGTCPPPVRCHYSIDAIRRVGRTF